MTEKPRKTVYLTNPRRGIDWVKALYETPDIAPAEDDLRDLWDRKFRKAAEDHGRALLTGVTTSTVEPSSSEGSLTMDDLRAAARALREDRSKIERDIVNAFRVPPGLLRDPVDGYLEGVPVTVSDLATEHDGWNWKPSRYRSKRVLKKLVKRFGSRERRKPAMFMTDIGDRKRYHIHPTIWNRLQKEARNAGTTAALHDGLRRP